MGSSDSVWLPGNYCSEEYRLRTSGLTVCISDTYILATMIFRGETLDWIKAAVSFEYVKDFSCDRRLFL